jgi:hypothetical protein
MALENTVNIKDLTKIDEINPGDLLVVETTNGTTALDFQNFVVGPDNVSWYTAFETVSTNLFGLSARVSTLSADMVSKPSGFTTVVSYSNGSGPGLIPGNVRNVRVTVVGGGGSGGTATPAAGSAGGGGGSGSVVVKYFTNISSYSFTYAVGTGGVAGAAGSNSSFVLGGTTVQAIGGSAGSAGSASVSTIVAGGAGGTAGTGGDYTLVGSAGSNGIGGAAVTSSTGGNGAPGYLGLGAGRGGVGSGGTGTAGANGTGAGGGGGNGVSGAGGSGGNGFILIEY